MKKTLILIIILSFILSFTTTATKILANKSEDSNIVIESPVGLLMEFSTGEIIYSKDIDERKYPASMTKMMGLYLILKKIKSKSISYDDIVTVSKNASSMGGSQVFLKEGEKITVNDLFKAICIASANDAIVALGEYAYGSEENFIDEMNKVAKELGMNDTKYVNPTGFHDENHYTTARDMSTLALALLTNYSDDILKYTSMYEGYIRENTSNPFWLVNTNKLVKFYEGMDGLKTGFTNNSGFCLTATAKKNGLRFITVIMDASSTSSRNADTVKLMDYGFNNYKLNTLYKKGETISTFSFKDVKEKNTPLISKEDITYVSKKNDNPSNINVSIDIDKYDAPINNEEIIGQITLTNPLNGWQTTFNLYSKNNIEKLSFKDILLNYFQRILS